MFDHKWTLVNHSDSHELIVLGGSDPGVGVDDRGLAHCLTADVLLAVFVPEGPVDLEAAPSGRRV